MQNEKCPGPDGFTVQFYKSFFDLLKNDLPTVVQECERTRGIHGLLNSTFLCLIPKREKAESLEDFRPISCCNLIYKLISKIILRRLRQMLNEIIKEEEFDFLHNRQIHDAVALAQEVLHFVKRKNLKAAIFKLDMSKAYLSFDWSSYKWE